MLGYSKRVQATDLPLSPSLSIRCCQTCVERSGDPEPSNHLGYSHGKRLLSGMQLLERSSPVDVETDGRRGGPPQRGPSSQRSLLLEPAVAGSIPLCPL